MNASDVPRCFRGNFAESQAYESGARAGARGLGADENPWREPLGWAGDHEAAASYSGGYHVADKRRAYKRPEDLRSRCGLGVWRLNEPFKPEAGIACQRCIRAVEAERKRLERAFEAGRLSTHPK